MEGVFFAVNSVCFLVAFPLYLYFRGCDAVGMYLAGGAVILCGLSNAALVIASRL